jgi:hypothetical protein
MSCTIRHDEELHLGLLVIKPWKQQSNNTVTDSLRLPEGIWLPGGIKESSKAIAQMRTATESIQLKVKEEYHSR